MPILHWLNDEEARKKSSQIPYRLLEAENDLSFGDSNSENMLIQGDNLEALKALLPYYTGQVKCIFIDPPYNTRSAFEHYDDNLEHSIWLSILYPRMELLRDLMKEDGSIWIVIDDNEGHYLKVIMDEIFNRKNFVASIVWQKVFAKKNKALISGSHDTILVYTKNIGVWKRNLLTRSGKNLKAFKNPDNDLRGLWQSVAYSVQSEDSEKRKDYRYEITLPSGRKVLPPSGRHWNGLPDRTIELINNNRLWFGKEGNNPPREKVFLSEVQDGIVPDSWWTQDDCGNNQESKKEMLALFPNTEPFKTPKPERLLNRIISIASNPGDLILDSFLGSGTTTAVAHKMGRRYIGIEMGEHALTHCVLRQKKVIEGEQGGISTAVNWKGGGGFNFYRLGETVFDEQGQINPKVKFKTLAAHVWFSETHTPLSKTPETTLLGVHNETALYLLFNGILGDKTQEGGNVLTARVLRQLPKHEGKKVIYGEMCMLDETSLLKQEITFKHIPYDIKAR
jgi:adenine-specific DNA-methyltransferase